MSGDTRIYVGNLPSGTYERDLERTFDQFGRIRDVVIKGNFGFVEFSDARDADDAIHDMHGRDFQGNRLIVELTKRRAGGGGGGRFGGGGGGGGRFRSPPRDRDRYPPPHDTKYRVIVENLSTHVDWKGLKDFMRKAGEVTYAEAHQTRKNEGLVCFATRRDMEKAMEACDNAEFNGRRVKLVDDCRRSKTRSKSRSRSRSRSKTRSRSRRSSRSRSAKRSRSRSKKSKSRSKSKEKSRSKSRSGSRRSRSRSAEETKVNGDAEMNGD